MNKITGALCASTIILVVLFLYQISESRRLARQLDVVATQLEVARVESERATARATSAEKRADAADAQLRSRPSITPAVVSNKSAPVPAPVAPKTVGMSGGTIGTISGRVRGAGEPPAPSKEEALVRNVEMADRAYESSYASLGIETAEQRAEFLKLKAKQLDEKNKEKQAIINRMMSDRAERDRLLSEVDERSYAAFIQSVKVVFGPKTGEAVDEFEKKRQGMASRPNSAGAFQSSGSLLPSPNK